MSQSIVWSIPASVIEESVKLKHSLEGPASVWACGFDEVGLNVFVVIDVDESDIDKFDVNDYHMLEEGELIQ